MTMKSLKNKFLGRTLKFWLWILILIPGIPFAVGSLFIVGYSNIPWPIGDSVQVGTIRDDIEELIVLAHGKGDTPSSWAEGFAHELERSVLNDGQQVVTVDWRDYSMDMFRCTLNGRRIGQEIGQKLIASKQLKRLHLIGHSAGAFVVYGICEAVKKKNGKIFVHTTYLDPVGIYGGIDWGYGVRNFGSCADISDAYIDHEDGVPGSDKPLKHPHTFDITALKKLERYNGSPHLWPIEYYRQAVVTNSLPFWVPDQAVQKKFSQKKSTTM